jgi:hypothetical protein
MWNNWYNPTKISRASVSRGLRAIGFIYLAFFVVFILMTAVAFTIQSLTFGSLRDLLFASLFGVPIMVFMMVPLVAFEPPRPRAALRAHLANPATRGFIANPTTLLRADALISATLCLAIIGSLFLPWGLTNTTGATPSLETGFWLLISAPQSIQLGINALIGLLLDLTVAQFILALIALRSSLMMASLVPRLGIFISLLGVFFTGLLRLLVGYTLHLVVLPSLWLPVIAFALLVVVNSVTRAILWVVQESVPPSAEEQTARRGMAAMFPPHRYAGDAVAPARIQTGAILLGLASCAFLGALFLPIGTIEHGNAATTQLSSLDLISGNLAGSQYFLGFCVILLSFCALALLSQSIIAAILSSRPSAPMRVPYALGYGSTILAVVMSMFFGVIVILGAVLVITLTPSTAIAFFHPDLFLKIDFLFLLDVFVLLNFGSQTIAHGCGTPPAPQPQFPGMPGFPFPVPTVPWDDPAA